MGFFDNNVASLKSILGNKLYIQVADDQYISDLVANSSAYGYAFIGNPKTYKFKWNNVDADTFSITGLAFTRNKGVTAHASRIYSMETHLFSYKDLYEKVNKLTEVKPDEFKDYRLGIYPFFDEVNAIQIAVTDKDGIDIACVILDPCKNDFGGYNYNFMYI